jgi:excisionase family DNA binding protein
MVGTGQTQMAHEPILTVEEVAERLQLKPETIYEMTRSRHPRPIPVLRAGKFLRFRWSAVERWLDGTNKVGGAKSPKPLPKALPHSRRYGCGHLVTLQSFFADFYL